MNIKKILTTLLIPLFTLQTVCAASPIPLTSEAAVDFERSPKLQISIPSEIGMLEDLKTASAERGMIIHIQDAHGNIPVQKNIGNALRYFTEQYGIRQIFLEGTHEFLRPEYLDFFSDRNLNKTLERKLLERGELNGAESFLLDLQRNISGKSGPEVQILGLEDSELYREAFGLFREVLSEKPRSETFLSELDSGFEKLGGRLFAKDLRRFMKSWKQFGENESGLLRFAKSVRKAARKVLDLDFSDSRIQAEYPAFLRFVKLQDINGTTDLKAAETERESFLGELEGKIDPVLWNEIRDVLTARETEAPANPRFVFEKLYAEMPGRVQFKKRPNLAGYISGLILRSELDSAELFREIDSLALRIMNRLADSGGSRQLVGLMRRTALFRKLLFLELTRAEYQEVRRNLAAFHPVGIVHEAEVLGGGEVRMPDLSRIEKPFRAALKFYETAGRREAQFLNSVLRAMDASSQRVVIVVTGGFHAAGMQDLFLKEGISCLSFRPRGGNPIEGSEGLDQYLKAMLAEESQIMLFPQLISDRGQMALGGEGYVKGRYSRLTGDIREIWGQNGRPGIRFRNRALRKMAESTFPELIPSIAGSREGPLAEAASLGDFSAAFGEIRTLLHEQKYPEADAKLAALAGPFLDSVLGRPFSELSAQELASYFALKLMQKVSRNPAQFFHAGTLSNSAQLLLVTRDGKVLTQKRGPYKRLFQSKKTVSASAFVAPEEQGERIEEKLATAAGKETGLSLTRNRLVRIGDVNGYAGYLRSYDFQAFSDEEAEKLRAAAEKIAGENPQMPDGVLLDYDPVKRALVVYVLKSDESLKRRMDEIAARIMKESGIAYFNPVDNPEKTSLYVCVLKPEEEAAIRERISQKEEMDPSSETDEGLLKTADSDEMNFDDLGEILAAFGQDPRQFAGDLTAQYFGDERTAELLRRITRAAGEVEKYEAQGQRYLRGDLKTPTESFVRFLRKSDAGLDLANLSPERRRALLTLAIDYLIEAKRRGEKIGVSVPVAGAMSRMGIGDIWPEIYSLAQSEAPERFGSPEEGAAGLPHAKALLPAAKIDGRWFDFFEYVMLNVRTVNRQLAEMGLGEPFFPKFLDSEAYHPGFENHPVHPEDALFFPQPLGLPIAASVDEVRANAGKFDSEEDYRYALDFAERNQGRPLVEFQPVPEGHGEYYHQHLTPLADYGGQTMYQLMRDRHSVYEYMHNIDNMAAVDEDWFVLFGYMLEQGLDALVEGSVRLAGTAGAGGGFALDADGKVKIPRDDVIRATIAEGLYDPLADERLHNPEGNDPPLMNNASIIAKTDSLFEALYGSDDEIAAALEDPSGQQLRDLAQRGREKMGILPPFKVMKDSAGRPVGVKILETESWNVVGLMERTGVALVPSARDAGEEVRRSGLPVTKENVRDSDLAGKSRFDPLKAKENFDDPELQGARERAVRKVVRGELFSQAFRDLVAERIQASSLGSGEELLGEARQLMHEGRYDEAKDILAAATSEIEGKVLGRKFAELDPGDVANYFALQLMKKVAKKPGQFFHDGEVSHSAQVLLLGGKGKVLVQRRGPYKRLFQSKMTVSASTFVVPGMSADEIQGKAVSALTGETGLQIDKARLERIGEVNGHNGYLESYDFQAFTDEEAERLRIAFEKSRRSNWAREGKLFFDYDPVKRALIAYVQENNPAFCMELYLTILQIMEESGIPYFNPVRNPERTTLFVCRLSPEEEEQLRLRTDVAISPIDPESAVDESLLKKLDSDEMRFESFRDITVGFRNDPTQFAGDLTAQYFGRDSVVAEIDGFLQIPPAEEEKDPVALRITQWSLEVNEHATKRDQEEVRKMHERLKQLAGGKGYNLMILQQLSRGKTWKVPEGFVVTTRLYDELVLGDPAIHEKIKLLDELSRKYRSFKAVKEAILEGGEQEGAGGTGTAAERLGTPEKMMLASIEILIKECRSEIEELAGQIEQAILEGKIPEKFERQFEEEFRRLGGAVYVRSSATVEDSKKTAAAGQGHTEGHIRSWPKAREEIKKVIASLFASGFVMNRVDSEDFRSHLDAKMAVVVQKAIDSRASGTAFSFDPAIHSPVIKVSAIHGLGEGAVQGNAGIDEWYVAPDAQHIFERNIADKSKGEKFVPADPDGTKKVPMTEEEKAKPALSDEEAREVGRAVREIYANYAANERGFAVDCEFAFDKSGNLFLTQTRPETTFNPSADVIEIEVVDESGVPPGTEKIRFEGAISGSQGVVRGPLQVLALPSGVSDQDLSRAIGEALSKVRSGVILVTNNTDNKWNAVFDRISGVVTNAGDALSHASINARERHFPALVKTGDATDRLEVFDGKMAVLDAHGKTIYITDKELPTRIETIHKKIWLPSDQVRHIAPGEQVLHRDIERRWRELDRSGKITMIDFEGRWRGRPKAPYGYFELDYYERAFRELPQMLEELFRRRGEAVPVPFVVPDLKIKQRIIYSRFLTSLLGTIRPLQALSFEQLKTILEEREKVFAEMEEFASPLQRIDAGNVKEVMDYLVKGLAWMHMSRAYHEVVTQSTETLCLDYIDPDYHKVFQTQALELTPRDERIWKRNVLVDEAQKERMVIRALAEREEGLIQRLEQIVVAGGEESVAEALKLLEEQYPELYGRMLNHCRNFKLGETEDIRVFDDLGKILGAILKIKSPDSKDLARYVRHYLWETDEKGQERPVSSHDAFLRIQKEDEDLALILEHFRERPEFLAFETMEEFLEHLRSVWIAESTANSEILEILKAYSSMRDGISFSAQERTALESQHQLITRYQRRIAPLMVEAVKQWPDIFTGEGGENLVFDISTAEFSALFFDPNAPQYIQKTFERRKIEEEAEENLEMTWGSDPEEALTGYRERVAVILKILGEQENAAADQNVRKYYESEREKWALRLQEREELAAHETIEDLGHLRGNAELEFFRAHMQKNPSVIDQRRLETRVLQFMDRLDSDRMRDLGRRITEGSPSASKIRETLSEAGFFGWQERVVQWGEAWRLQSGEGEFMNFKQHQDLILKGLEILEKAVATEGGRGVDSLTAYLRSKSLEHYLPVDRRRAQDFATLYRNLNEEERQLLRLAAVFYDFGKVVTSEQDHPEVGARLADRLFEKMDMAPRTRKILKTIIERELVFGVLHWGEMNPEQLFVGLDEEEKAMFLRVMSILHILIVSAHGEGKVSPRHIRNAVFLSKPENIAKLRQDWARLRIMGFFVEQRGQILDLTEPDRLSHREEKPGGPEQQRLLSREKELNRRKTQAREVYQKLLETDADFRTFMEEMSFYNFIYVAKGMVSRGHPENVVKFLFLLSRIYKIYRDRFTTDYMGISRDWSQYAILLDRVLEKISIDELTSERVSYEIAGTESGGLELRVSSPADINLSLPFDISVGGHLRVHIEKLRKPVQSLRDLSWFMASLRPEMKETEGGPLEEDDSLAWMISGLYRVAKEESPENFERMFEAIRRHQETIRNDAEYADLKLDAVQKYALGLSVILRDVYYPIVEKSGLYWGMKILEHLGVDNLTAELTTALVWLYPSYRRAVRGGEANTEEFLKRVETVLGYWRERGIFQDVSRDRLTALLNFHLKGEDGIETAASLGAGAMENVLEDAAERYSGENGRPEPGIVSEVAQSLGMGTYWIPNAMAALYYFEMVSGSMEKQPASASVRAFNLGRMSPYILRYLGINKADSSGPFVVYVDGLLDEKSAERLAGTMKKNEQLIAVWNSLRNKGVVPRLIEKFFKARHFKSRAIPDTLFDVKQLRQLLKLWDGAVLVIFSSDGNEEVLVDAGNGFRIRFQVRELIAGGLDVGQVVTLIKQIMEDPENAGKHLNRVGVFEKDGFWMVGSGLIRFLESLYDRFMASEEIRTAA